jgi:hypothetical protein
MYEGRKCEKKILRIKEGKTDGKKIERREKNKDKVLNFQSSAFLGGTPLTSSRGQPEDTRRPWDCARRRRSSLSLISDRMLGRALKLICHVRYGPKHIPCFTCNQIYFLQSTGK